MDATRILLADDEEDVHFLCRINLELEGFELTSASNGEEALRMLREGRRPDLVLLDVMMPLMDGWECLGAMKADPGLRDVPVVMLTAKVHQDDQVRGLAAGADHYVTKPFHPSTVINAVREVLGADTDKREERRQAALRQLRLLQRL